MTEVHWFQLLKCKYLLVSIQFYDSKLNILWVWTVGQTKRDIFKLSSIMYKKKNIDHTQGEEMYDIIPDSATSSFPSGQFKTCDGQFHTLITF